MFARQIIADTDFLSQHSINDYSLLLGIHKLQATPNEKAEFQKITINYIHGMLADDTKRPKPFVEIHEGGIVSEDFTQVYFVGIIDIFTEYRSAFFSFCEIEPENKPTKIV